ncbi:hypothetical protein DID88_000677 [Monilinia fructigena]|uniref:Dynactin subunit 4 n=1 Tax=Monilinia fructigena TaxID=38457 RepID=A0A395IIM6_9HELO|nr:hypothetical protein DID88_000677 [Monilinia fructigena]
MSTFKPYTYFQCPCSDTSIPSNSSTPPDSPTHEEERTFDPRAPRANYSLYPLEHLLYCEDCHQIRCSRCVLDEIVTWYCPSCLFEVPSSTVKSEGNRCTRSCFQCPICISPLSVTEAPLPNHYGHNTNPAGSPLSSIAHTNGGTALINAKERRRDREERRSSLATETILEDADEVTEKHVDPNEKLDIESQYANLKSFYQVLTPLQPTQFLLTFKNPLFEPVKISLATKGLTTDRHASKVILLCPQFDVGANTDMWDEALQDSSSGNPHDRKHSTATHASMTSIDLANEAHGKPWDKGRNWTSVVVEVTPGKLKAKLPGLEQQRRLEEEVQKERVEEDADVCEIAVFVRVEWEADAAGTEREKWGGWGIRTGGRRGNWLIGAWWAWAELENRIEIRKGRWSVLPCRCRGSTPSSQTGAPRRQWNYRACIQ